jgi:hypothetical protein
MVCLSALAAAFSVPAPAPADPAMPAHTSTYAYTYERDLSYSTEHAYGKFKMDTGSGATFYFHNVNQHYRPPSGGGYDRPERRSGNVTVGVLREEPDGGLVLRVTESDSTAASPKTTTCVAFGDTTVVCDPNVQTGPELPVLMALMGKRFFDPARLDSDRHWHVQSQGSTENVADYRIVNVRGSLVDIDEDAVRSEASSNWKTLTKAVIEYDAARSLPTSIDESTVRRSQTGIVYETAETHVTFALEAVPI